MISSDYIMPDRESLKDALAYDLDFFGQDEMRLWCTTTSPYYKALNKIIDDGFIVVVNMMPMKRTNGRPTEYDSGVLIDLHITQPYRLLLELYLL